MTNMQRNSYVKKGAIVLLWLAVWQGLTWLTGNRLLMAGPYETAKAWIENIQDAAFVKIILFSLARIGGGFLTAFAAGVLLGTAAYRIRTVREILSPFMTFIKAVPVASFVVLLLIWWGSERLSAAVVFCIVLPNVYESVLHGLSCADPKMLELARVFDMPVKNRFFYIYRPALKPFMDNCLRISLGMSWKSGVAAEVIGTPDFSIGERLYMSKIYLDTAGVFAWTLTVILLSYLFEKCGLFIWKRFCEWKPVCREPVHRETAWETELAQVDKTFDGKKVLSGVTKKIEKGKIYCLMALSGAGKTTLLRVISGLEGADKGAAVKQKLKYSVVFQEDRLAEDETAETNVMMVCGSRKQAEIRAHLESLLSEGEGKKKCAAMSGGMKRRVCLARAVLSKSDVLLLDEPFAGLDEETRKRAAEYLLQHREGRTVILATHDETDSRILGGEIWRLSAPCE